MAKLGLAKKWLVIIIIVAVLAVAGGAYGAVYGVTHRKLKTPTAEVTSVVGEPDYTITISWNKVSGARVYTVEYIYSVYPDTVYTANEIGGTELTIKRVKGELKFRIKALGKYESNTSDFSEWYSYNVVPLTLDPFRGITFKNVGNQGYQIDMDYFYPVTYVYKGEQFTINYYEVDAIGPGEERDQNSLQPYAYSLLELHEGVTFNFPVGSGTWQFYIRPVLYVNVNGVKEYIHNKEIYELYDEEIPYTIIEQTV